MKLPPLNALRVFETAARKGSFVAAGEELGVTSAAVSLQVRSLESWLGHDLFFRRNNQIRLTDAGEDLYRNAAKSLTEIAAYTHSVQQGQSQQMLTISALPSLAERIMPRVLATLDLTTPIALLSAEDPVDLDRRNIAIHVSYGAKNYPDHVQTKLHQDRVVPMAHPKFNSTDITDLPLIEIDWGRSFTRAPKWANWFATHGITAPAAPPAYRVSTTSLGIALAEQGLGVVLGQRMLTAGTQLVPLSPKTLPLQEAYFAISAHHNSHTKPIKTALVALKAAFSET